MANDLNLCQFIGRLGADPEIRHTSSGLTIASIRLACGWKTKDKEGTEWVSASFFGKPAEIVGEYCKKGSQIYIAGRLNTEKWQDKEGNDRYTTKVNVNNFQLLGGKSEGSRTGDQQTGQQSPSTSGGGNPPQDDFDDDIPFISCELNTTDKPRKRKHNI